jgi:uncharacterized protein YndB with AHSA1/START domain
MTETAVLENRSTRSDLSLQVSRVIAAERSRVYQAWTRPELIAQWFAPGKTITNITSDPRPGGEYRFDFFGMPCDADTAAPQVPAAVNVVGVYQEVVPDERISYTWRGSRFPDENTLVTVTFKDAEGGTEVTIRHENFSTAEIMSPHNLGWEGALSSLENFLKK